jgi:uncharacterized membrane protein
MEAEMSRHRADTEERVSVALGYAGTLIALVVSFFAWEGTWVENLVIVGFVLLLLVFLSRYFVRPWFERRSDARELRAAGDG